MKRKVSFLSILFLIFGCRAQHNTLSCHQFKNEIQVFMEYQYKELKKSHVKLESKVLSTTSSAKNTSLKALFSDEYFALLRNFDIQSANDIVHFDQVFGDKEYSYLKKQLDCPEFSSWSEIGILEQVDGNTGLESISFSIPVFSEDRNYAFIYAESSFSGEIKVFKKENGKWFYFAQSTVWIS